MKKDGILTMVFYLSILVVKIQHRVPSTKKEGKIDRSEVQFWVNQIITLIISVFFSDCLLGVC